MALLELRQVSCHFEIRPGLIGRVLHNRDSRWIKAVEGVNFSLGEDEVLGIAGESGCGKSTTCNMIAGLLPTSSGEIHYRGKRVDNLRGEALRQHRRHVQMIFQDPYESLNPRFRIYDIVSEGPRAMALWPEAEIKTRVDEMLESVDLAPGKYSERFPHELSGGERQRVGIASALVMEPETVIADEPLSMLDVSIRAGILDLIRKLASERHFACVYVSHDLSILGNIADRLLVMYLGQAVEIGPVEQVIRNPKHPYTRALIGAVPVPDPRYRRPIPKISGDIARPIDPPPGCRFAPRCPHADESCGQNFLSLDTRDPNAHQAACHRLEHIANEPL